MYFGRVTVDLMLTKLTEDEREILCRFMQQGMQALGNGDFTGSIFGTAVPPGGEPEYAERDEDGYLQNQTELNFVAPIFAKLFPGREVYEFNRPYDFNRTDQDQEG